MSAAELDTLRAQLDGARSALHDAQNVVALLAVDDDGDGGDAVKIARRIIERDLAARRVEAWTGVLDRLRSEARRHGLFSE